MTEGRSKPKGWNATRLRILKRDGGVCQVPLARGLCGRPATHCGHIIAWVDGGPDSDDNLRAECEMHSSRDGARLSTRVRRQRVAAGNRALAILASEGREREARASSAHPRVFSDAAQHPSPLRVTALSQSEEPVGIAADDERWLQGAPWLAELLPMPSDATWPRYMSAPHPRAVGTLGPEFCQWAAERTGKPLRWWQRLVAYRLLEVDATGALVWESLILSMARQLGKSWLLRELCLWRLHQGERFGEEQLIVHTGKDLNVCDEVQRPARRWAREQGDAFKVREANGQVEIAYLPDGSRWMLRARESVYGYSVSVGAVDEAWKVANSVVDEGLEPTMAERVQPQLLLISTAHRAATSLMVRRRAAAIAELEEPHEALVMEWSAPRSAPLGEVETWRAASPHWSDRRHRLIAGRYTAAAEGTLADQEESDPTEAFRSQWLNQWPIVRKEVAEAKDEPLLAAGAWKAAFYDGMEAEGDLFLAVEDWFGHGAAAAAVGMVGEGYTVGGWEFDSWADAFQWVANWCEMREGCRVLVGASMAASPEVAELAAASVSAVGRAQTGPALALFRDLVKAGRITHDGSEDLARQVTDARVVAPPNGPMRLGASRSDLLRCAVWALAAAEESRSTPKVAIY